MQLAVIQHINGGGVNFWTSLSGSVASLRPYIRAKVTEKPCTDVFLSCCIKLINYHNKLKFNVL